MVNTTEDLRTDEQAEIIDKVKELIKIRLIDSLSLKDCTKYGNKDAKQQANSYATVMKYEIADCVEDLLDDLEKLKEKKMSKTLEVKICLNSVDKVKEFVNIIDKEEDDFDLIGGNHYVVDAKSIMGIFSLDLSKNLVLKSQNCKDVEGLKKRIADYIVE